MDVLVGNSAVGVNNPAICTFHFLSPVPVDRATALAQAIGMLQYSSPGSATFIAGARWTPAGADGSVPLPWPTAEYSAIHTADPDNTAELGSFGATFGAGEISAVGVGITLSLYTAIPGRKTTGRLYTPWTSEAAIVSGYVSPGARSGVVAGYRRYILGEAAWCEPLGPVVHSATEGDTLIVTPNASITPSRLKTRTR